MNRDCFLALSLITGTTLAIGCGPTPVAAAVQEAAPSLEPTSTTVFGERLLLFLEYPHLVRGAPARFLAHLSVLEDGEPVRSGRVELEIGSSRFAVDAPKRDGLFVPEGSLPEAGTFPGRLVVQSEQGQETLDLGELVVHATEQEAASAASSAAEDPAGAVPFLMEQQWKVRLLLAEAGPRTLTRRLVVPAQVRIPEGAEAVVSSPVGGRLLTRDGPLPRTGDAVAADRVIAEVEPPLGAAEIAELQALSLELDLKGLDIVRALEEARAHVDFSQRERDRIVKLREQGLSTQQSLDEAELDLRIAQGELAGATATKEALDRLLEQRRGRAGSVPDLGLRLPIASPLTGTVVSASVLPGAAIEAGDELFRVLNTSRVWIEGRVSEFDLALVGPEPEGIATFAALPGVRLDVGGPLPLRRLPLLDAASRTATLRCEVPNADGKVMPGMLAELELALERVEAAVVVPREAVVIDQGLPAAYVMLEGETFQKRDLELGIEDGDFVEVRRGIGAGERVATRGAYVVKLAALSPASFGPGHQH